jgi:glycosyltransferase involved in cell wall biosynthesis
MACGLPVVASNAASIPEVIGDGGIVIDPLDVDGFASEALNILTDEQIAKQMTERGMMRSQHFSWERCAKSTLKVYEAASQ